MPGSCIGHMLHHLCSPPKQAITQIKFKPRIKAFALVCAKNYVFFSVYKNLLFLFYLLPFQNTLHYIIYFTLYFNKCQFYLIFNCFFVFCTQPPPSTLFTGVGEPKPISKGGEAKYNKILKKKRKKRKKKREIHGPNQILYILQYIQPNLLLLLGQIKIGKCHL